jgi:cell wall-associated NlpC family hydrolase
MIAPAFLNDDLWNHASAVIDSWMKTPYRHLWMTKGRGADCSLFIAAIFQELGLIAGKIQHQHYPKDWYLHSATEAIRDCFINNVAAKLPVGYVATESSLKDSSPLMRGDVVGFCMIRQTGVTNHIGMMLSEAEFVHSVQKRGVSTMQWGHFWSARTSVVYRLVLDGI